MSSRTMSLACLSEARSTIRRAKSSAAALSGVGGGVSAEARGDWDGSSKAWSASRSEGSRPAMFRAGLAARWLGLPRVPVCDERKRDYSTHHASHPEAEDTFTMQTGPQDEF